jgi:hypothetical protein
LDLSYLTDLHPPKVSAKPINNDNNPHENEEQKLETAFDRLVLEKGQKPMIQALVAQHFRDKESQTGHMEQVDIVKGKGEPVCRKISAEILWNDNNLQGRV